MSTKNIHAELGCYFRSSIEVNIRQTQDAISWLSIFIVEDERVTLGFQRGTNMI